MINNIIILALCLPLLTLAQKESLTYNQLQDIKFAEQYENNTLIDSYTTKGGLIICIGDTLTIGNAVIKGGDYMFDDVFSHIVVGKTKGAYNKDFKSLPHKYSGSKVIIKSLFVTHEKYTGYKLWPNRNKMPLYVSIFGRSPKKGFSKLLGFSLLGNYALSMQIFSVANILPSIVYQYTFYVIHSYLSLKYRGS